MSTSNDLEDWKIAETKAEAAADGSEDGEYCPVGLKENQSADTAQRTIKQIGKELGKVQDSASASKAPEKTKDRRDGKGRPLGKQTKQTSQPE